MCGFVFTTFLWACCYFFCAGRSRGCKKRSTALHCTHESFLTKTTGFALRLEQDQDVSLTDGTLDVTDDGALAVIEELDADLSDTSARTGTAQNLGDLGLFDFVLHHRRQTEEKNTAIIIIVVFFFERKRGEREGNGVRTVDGEWEEGRGCGKGRTQR